MSTQSDRGPVVLAAVFLGILAVAGVSSAQTFKKLVDFDGTNGSRPYDALVQGLDGNFYGTTIYGGANSNETCYSYNCGTVFKVTPAGTLTTLHSFCAQPNCADGTQPYSGLVLGNDGNLYGTTYYGGDLNGNCIGVGCGTVFEITPTGALTTVYTFCDHRTACGDGSFPRAALIQGADGNLYGTTSWGGTSNACSYQGCGTVFKLTAAGKLTTLHSFDSTDGSSPYAGLVQASDGNFYGTTSSGGANNEGTVFKITPSGTLTTLYSFCAQTGCTDGQVPYSSLVQASDSNLYGTTLQGGENDWGTVFKITPAGELTTLYNFCAQNSCRDGGSPYGGLIQATDGNLYGTTGSGGVFGTVFKITLAGVLTTVHTFGPGGGNPEAALVQATNGAFYGTTIYGGSSDSCQGGCGTAFGVITGLGPFVETLPGSGRVGAAVKILGNQLTGATSVTFNGVSASFKVVSPTEMTTTVPAGATTGEVVVTKPNGTVQSNVPFRVLQ